MIEEVNNDSERLYAACVDAMMSRKYEVALVSLENLEKLGVGQSIFKDQLTPHDVHMLKGNCRLNIEDLQGAKEEFERALHEFPESAGACFGLGLCFQYAGLSDAARRMYSSALALNPGWEQARLKILECNGAMN